MSVIKGIKVGTTNITSTYTDISTQSDVKELKVTAVELYYIDTPNDATYTGMPHNPHPIVKAIVSGGEIELEEDKDYILSFFNNINVGEATVKATGINNFCGEVSSTWMIKNADIDVVAEKQSYTYNGNLLGEPISATSVNNQKIDIKYGVVEGTYDIIDAPKIKNVKDSKTIFYQITAPNHNTVFGSYELEIEPIESSLRWGNLVWVYDGDEHSTTCVVNNLIYGDVCEVNLLYNSITNIGTVDVFADSLSNDNYKLPSRDLCMTMVVSPGLFINASNSWTPVKKVYKKISGRWERIEYKDMNSAFGGSGTLYTNKT